MFMFSDCLTSPLFSLTLFLLTSTAPEGAAWGCCCYWKKGSAPFLFMALIFYTCSVPFSLPIWALCSQLREVAEMIWLMVGVTTALVTSLGCASNYVITSMEAGSLESRIMAWRFTGIGYLAVARQVNNVWKLANAREGLALPGIIASITTLKSAKTWGRPYLP